MNKSKGFVAIVILVTLVLLVGVIGYSYLSGSSSSPTEKVSQAREKVQEINQETEKKAQQVSSVDNPAQILEYSDATYQEALDSGKLVVLYFYANWCPICRNEFPKMQDALTQFDGESVVGIRVNYNDSDVTDEEEAIAKKFDIPYQHTKVFLKDGEVVLKDLESWKEERYISEINKYI